MTLWKPLLNSKRRPAIRTKSESVKDPPPLTHTHTHSLTHAHTGTRQGRGGGGRGEGGGGRIREGKGPHTAIRRALFAKPKTKDPKVQRSKDPNTKRNTKRIGACTVALFPRTYRHLSWPKQLYHTSYKHIGKHTFFQNDMSK